MATQTTKTATVTQNTKVNNAYVRASKQTVTDEDGKVVKTLYHLAIASEKGAVTLNVGEKTYTQIKQLAE